MEKTWDTIEVGDEIESHDAYRRFKVVGITDGVLFTVKVNNIDNDEYQVMTNLKEQFIKLEWKIIV